MLAGGALIYLNSSSFQQTVRRRVILELEHLTGGKVEIASLSWKLSTLQIEVRGLTIHGLEDANQAPYAHADRISLAVKIISFFSPKVALSNVAIDHVTVHLIIYPNGTTNQPEPIEKADSAGRQKGAQHLFDLSVKSIQISDGTLILNQEQIPFSITGERLDAIPPTPRGTKVTRAIFPCHSCLRAGVTWPRSRAISTFNSCCAVMRRSSSLFISAL